MLFWETCSYQGIATFSRCPQTRDLSAADVAMAGLRFGELNNGPPQILMLSSDM